MLVVLPDAGRVEHVERRLAAGLLGKIAVALQPRYLAIALPRFRIESKHDLAAALADMGAPTAFRDRADFSGMTAQGAAVPRRGAAEGVHPADEAGTEAAAATGVVVEALSAEPRPRPFVVDRPFLFVIRDRPTGAVLFSGRVADPSRG